DYVGPDVIRSIVARDRTRETDDPAFACRIGVRGKVPVPADEPEHRGKVHDAPTASIDHRPHGVFTAQEDAFEVDVHHTVPRFLRTLIDRSVTPPTSAYPCDVEEDVRPAVPFRHVLEGGLHRPGVGDVSFNKYCLAASFGDFPGGSGPGFGVDLDCRDRRAAACKKQRGRPTDSPSGAGYDRTFAFEQVGVHCADLLTAASIGPPHASPVVVVTLVETLPGALASQEERARQHERRVAEGRQLLGD